jgi:hypothetical protein
MSQSTKHSKTQPHDHGRSPEGRQKGIEEGGRESLNQALQDGELRGVNDNPAVMNELGHDAKKGSEGYGGESEGRRRGLDAGGGSPLNQSLEDGQLRGVDEDGQITQGTHGGPQKKGNEPTTMRKRG